MQQFVALTPKEYGIIRGKKLSFIEKLKFKVAQKQIKKKLQDPDTRRFNVIGFLLGFFLGLIGVLVAYVFTKDRSLRRWVWYGWFGWLIILVAILLANSSLY